MSVIDDIKDRLDIVDLIGQSVSLRKAGKNFVGFCPFHTNTRTPALTVFPDTQSFYCFGCHASGTVFDFVMRQQGLDFPAALQHLADLAGVQLKERTPDEQQRDQQRTRLLDINTAAARYFNYVLLSLERGQPARDYVARRAITPETVEAFQLGYSLDEREHLLNYLTGRKGFLSDEVVAAGLAIKRDDGGYYDRFRGRLIFPIRNLRGEIVGFGGRALGDAQPKYLNTPQTLLFDKSQVLYGLDLARDAIRAANATVIVEGYVDVLMAHQHGFRNVVAPLGTALTAEHVALLKKLSRNVYLALDADAAGQRATLRGMDTFQQVTSQDAARATVTAQGLVRWESDILLHIIKLPPGQDPDEVIKTDPQRWQHLVNTALPVMDFYIEAYTADLDFTQARDQQRALDRLLPLIAQLNGTQQRVYLARLEQVIGIKAELILDLLRSAAAHDGQRAGRGPRSRQSDSSVSPATEETGSVQPASRTASGMLREDLLLALLLRYPATHAMVEQWLEQDTQEFPLLRNLLGQRIANLLERTENRLLWQAFQAHRDDGDGAEVAAWLVTLAEPLRTYGQTLLQHQLPRSQEYRYRQDLEYSVKYLRIEQARRWYRRVTQQLAHQDATDVADTKHYSIQLLEELNRYLRRISTPRRSSNFPDLRDTLRR